MNMQPAEFGAAVQLRENFSGIEQAFGVERTLHPLLLIEVDLREHHRHQVALLHADAVLAGEHAADLDAQLEDLGAEFLRLLQLAWNIGIIENERMQIAVAGMEHIGDPQTVFCRHLFHALENQRQLRARNGAIHAEVVR